MTSSQEHSKLQQLIQKLDPHATLLRAWPLKGGVSAQVTALEIAQPGGHTRKLIVRRHGPADLQQNPNTAVHEFKLLQFLKAHGLPVPTPYYLDQSGATFPTPCIVIEYIEGETDFAPANLPDHLLQLATHLAAIHKIDASVEALSFLPLQQEIYARRLAHRPTTPDETLHETRIRHTLQAAWPLPHPNRPALLHGDYWPGNTLWQDNRLAAIIDWEDAALGDPLADLANARLELLWAFGPEAMRTFTHHYQSQTSIDCTTLPYHDLFAALHPIPKLAEWAPDAITEKSMREGLKQFITQALDKLSIESNK